MSYNAQQFQDFIERTLEELDPALNSPVAVKLLMGTAAQESHLGTYLRQVKGPAVGAFQIEKATFDDIRDRFKDKYPVLAGREHWELEWDLRLGVIIARLKYRSDPQPLPADNIGEIAATWKRVYNTVMGSGTISEFVTNYRRYVDEYV